MIEKHKSGKSETKIRQHIKEINTTEKRETRQQETQAKPENDARCWLAFFFLSFISQT
jgi:hypothetical protein